MCIRDSAKSNSQPGQRQRSGNCRQGDARGAHPGGGVQPATKGIASPGDHGIEDVLGLVAGFPPDRRKQRLTRRAQASPQKMRALVDELEALSGPSFDPRYFQSLRTMLDQNAKLQQLNAELQVLTKSKAPKDAARQEAILAEMRAICLLYTSRCV